MEECGLLLVSLVSLGSSICKRRQNACAVGHALFGGKIVRWAWSVPLRCASIKLARGGTPATAEFFRAPDLAHGSRIPRSAAWLEEWAELLLRSLGRDREQL